MRAPLAPLLLLLAATPAARAGDDGISCSGGIVSVGDSRLDLLGKCGAATLVESRTSQVNEWQSDWFQAVGRTVTVGVETWTYDFGKARLVHQVLLEAGRVTRVRTLGYGRAASPPAPASIPRAACEPASIRPGDATYDLLSSCGEPVYRDVVEEQVAVAQGDARAAQGATATRVRETWTYDFGPRALVRHVLVEDGRVRRVVTGGYGYSG
ncbi:MAG TPA: DUF2845 domain-containing protein [Anaeromyxobacteraceae bacterium]|nr:DUF2845 domain-containing protein [Anaeromyxobacteraceae bacterium]